MTSLFSFLGGTNAPLEKVNTGATSGKEAEKVDLDAPTDLYTDMKAHKPMRGVGTNGIDLPDRHSSNPGAGKWITDGSAKSYFGAIKKAFVERGARGDKDEMLLPLNIRDPTDIQNKPPKWMIEKNVAIDGSPLTVEEKGENWWEHKYRKELLIGEEKARIRVLNFEEDVRSDAWHIKYRQARRMIGLDPEIPTYDEVARNVEESLEMEKEDRKRGLGSKRGGDNLNSNTLPGGGDGKNSNNGNSDDSNDNIYGASWDELISDLEQSKPLAVVAKKAKPKVDLFCMDQFLDSAPTVAWMTTKIGIFIGSCHGGFRAVKATQVDAQFLRASGVGIFSVVAVAMFGSTMKWGGNCLLFSLCFLMGDRAATVAKSMMLPPHEAVQRTPVNYSAGMALSFAAVGVVPYWMLRDPMLALRTAGNGIVIGSVLGWATGSIMAKMVTAAVNRLEAKPRELRRYEALMKRSGTFQRSIMDRRYEIQAI